MSLRKAFVVAIGINLSVILLGLMMAEITLAFK